MKIDEAPLADCLAHPSVLGLPEDVLVLLPDLRVDGVVAQFGAAVRVRVGERLERAPDHGGRTDEVAAELKREREGLKRNGETTKTFKS